MRMASRTLAIAVADELRQVVDLGDSDAGWQGAREVASAASTPCFTARMLAPICCEMLIEIASRPLPVTSSVRSGAPGTTVPRSETRMVAPFLDDHRRAGDLVGARPQPRREREVLLARSARIGPTGAQLVLRLQRFGDVGDGEVGGSELQRDRAPPRSRACRSPAPRSGRRPARAPAPAHHVDRVVVQLGRGKVAGHAEDEHREDRRRQPLDDQLGVGGQFAANLRDPVLHLLQRDDHVGGGIELRGDFGGAADASRPHAADAGHLHHRLLDRPRDRQHHRLRRQRAALGDDDDAGELERRIDAARQREGARWRRRRRARRRRATAARPCRMRQGGDVHWLRAALDGDGGAVGKTRLPARDHRARRP